MRPILFIPLALFALTAPRAGVAQGATEVRRLRGNDARGRYDLQWVQLTPRFADAAVRRRVNEAVEAEARGYLCEPYPERVKSLEMDLEMAVSYLDRRVLGITTRYTGFCGGAHPVYGEGALIYDLRTGKRIEVEDEVAKPPAFRRFVAVRAHQAAPRDAEECGGEYGVDRLADFGFIYQLGPRGLVAIPDYPYVMLACGFDTVIPYPDILPFLKPGSPLRGLRR